MINDYDNLLKYLTAVMAIDAKNRHMVFLMLRDMRQAPSVAKILKNNGIEYVRERRGFQVKCSSELVNRVFNKFNDIDVPVQDIDFLSKRMMKQFGM